MRFSLALIAAVAAVTSVAAQDVASIVSQIPSCALTCIATAAAGQSCTITDYKCQCSKMSAIQASATGCVTTKCTTDEAIKVLSLTGDLCKAVGGTTSSSSSAAAGGANSGDSTTQAAGGGAAASPTTNASFATSSTANSSFEPTASATTSGAETQPTGAFTQAPVATGAASRMGGSGAAAAVVAVAAFML
ncbi:hypothetical protein V502_04867 [Pseudogymnoascus sp. VKM F-4520 (FW-2644)]|nr:hypothetical protein V502_04867 [Pseudogymnoascus sp. VKM F-4520 (FW-2644)]